MTGVHAASAVAPVVLLPAANRQLSMIPGVEVSPMKDENVHEPPITPEEIRPANPGLGKRFFEARVCGADLFRRDGRFMNVFVLHGGHLDARNHAKLAI